MTHDSPAHSAIHVPALLAALPRRIAEIPALAAARDPQHVALIEDARRLTSAQLLEAVNATAQQLRERGVRSGDRVMIVAENSIAQIVLLFA
ncbi:MAG: AMP-binding protein, partial [Paraburkholderia sp.]